MNTDYLNKRVDLNQWVDFGDELPIWSAPFGLKLLDAIDYKPGLRVLDIGFGTGFPLIELAARLGQQTVVYGVDPWQQAVERTRAKLEFYNITNVQLLDASAEAMPLGNDDIDLIVSNNGINNVIDMDQALAECARVLKPGGQFVFTMNLEQTMFEFYDQLELVLTDMQIPKEVQQMYSHIEKKRPPVGQILRKLKKLGLSVKDVEYDQFNYRFADGTAMLNHYFIRLAFMDSWIELVPASKQRAVFDQIENRLNALALQAGGIKLSVPFALIKVEKPVSQN